MNLGNGTQTYLERQSVEINIGEELFERYCKNKGYDFIRIGFDEKHNNVPNFYHLNKVLRYLPDYVVNTKTNTFVVNVKGTINFKESEFKELDSFKNNYSTQNAPLVYAFCLRSLETPIFVSVNQIKTLWEAAKIDKQWNDGKVYRTLSLTNSQH